MSGNGSDDQSIASFDRSKIEICIIIIRDMICSTPDKLCYYSQNLRSRTRQIRINKSYTCSIIIVNLTQYLKPKVKNLQLQTPLDPPTFLTTEHRTRTLGSRTQVVEICTVEEVTQVTHKLHPLSANCHHPINTLLQNQTPSLDSFMTGAASENQDLSRTKAKNGVQMVQITRKLYCP